MRLKANRERGRSHGGFHSPGRPTSAIHNATDGPRASRGRGADRCQSIVDTIVQWIRLYASGLIASIHRIDIRIGATGKSSEKRFGKETMRSRLAFSLRRLATRRSSPVLAHIQKRGLLSRGI